MNLATALYGVGDVDQALCSFTWSQHQATASQTLVCLIGAMGGVASCHLQKGELVRAVEVVEQGVEMLGRNGWLEQMNDMAWLYMALGDIAYERNELLEVDAWFAKAQTLAESDRWDTIAALVTIRQAKLYFYQGKHRCLAAALQRYQDYDIKQALLPLMAAPELDRLNLSLRRGEMAPLVAWQRRSAYSAVEQIAAGYEDEYCLYARPLLLQGDAAGAASIADQLRVAARRQECLGDWVVFSVLYALTQQALGDLRRALAALKEIWSIVESQRHVRVFIEEGQAMALLLAELTQAQQYRSYSSWLLRQFERLFHNLGHEKSANEDATNVLSKGETKTLALLAQGLSNREIAEQAFVSVNTVKTHLKNIYAKLDVENRVQAIKKFRQG